RGKRFPSLIDATIEDITAGLEDGVFTSVDLVKTYIARIEEVNPVLHAVTEVNPLALKVAAELDEERACGEVRGPLHGVPLLLKNNIGTFTPPDSPSMNTTAGSTSLIGAHLPRDSHLASLLLSSGAILLGKSNLSQWANYRMNLGSNGWSTHGGQVYGPFYPSQDPSGSSSGSAVGTALGLAAGSLGTETSGSIISPSQKNGIVGIKPTVGLTSRDLVIPISEHQDTVGPMARTVRDAAVILSVLAGRDEKDNYTSAIPFGSIPDYPSACQLSGLEGKRLGVPRNAELFATPLYPNFTLAKFDSVLPLLSSAGAEMVDPAAFPFADPLDRYPPESSTVLASDFLANLPRYLRNLVRNPANITDLPSEREYTTGVGAGPEQYPEHDVGVWDFVLENVSFPNTDPRFWPAYQAVLRWGGEFLSIFDTYDLDAIVMPSYYAAVFAAGVGAPLVTVPLGYAPDGTDVEYNARGNLVDQGPGIPYGLAFLGKHWTEEALIGMAYAFEQRTNFRADGNPYIVPSAELVDFVEEC
ncbi:putative glutamyl-trna amidotransferase subunit a protein, partial [Zalerion maritima]